MNLNPLIGAFMVAVTFSGCASTQNTHKPTVTEGSSINTIQSITDHMDRDIADIKEDATYIQTESEKADKELDFMYERVATEDKPRMDNAIDSVWEMRTHADQIVVASDRLQEENDKLQEVMAQVKKMEDRVAELQNLEKEGRAKAMEKLYGYITLFWVIGFIVIAGGSAVAFFVSKKMGLLLIMVGGVMIGFASASQYYLQEIAMVGGILLIGLIVSGVGMLVWSMIKSNRSDTAMKEIVEMIEILKETMTEDENERIFGANGVASKVQSPLTRQIITTIKEHSGMKRAAEVRTLAKEARGEDDGADSPKG